MKRLLPVHCFSSSHIHYMNIAFQWSLMTRCSGLFVWNKITVTHSCSFDDAFRDTFHLFPNFPEIKKKKTTKEMFKFIA